jgi:hypothetical protein
MDHGRRSKSTSQYCRHAGSWSRVKTKEVNICNSEVASNTPVKYKEERSAVRCDSDRARAGSIGVKAPILSR